MAAKLKDGLFLGDFETAQDMEFIMANKISRIINCAGREVRTVRRGAQCTAMLHALGFAVHLACTMQLLHMPVPRNSGA